MHLLCQDLTTVIVFALHEWLLTNEFRSLYPKKKKMKIGKRVNDSVASHRKYRLLSLFIIKDNLFYPYSVAKLILFQGRCFQTLNHIHSDIILG